MLYTQTMKSLTAYIKEGLDEDNLIWKIETWFKKKPNEYKEFADIVNKCVADRVVSKENLENYLKNTNIKLKPFIDFLDDDIYGTDTTKDYLYLLKKVIECIIANKQVEM